MMTYFDKCLYSQNVVAEISHEKVVKEKKMTPKITWLGQSDKF